ncbi:MAG: Holliday junction branch migration protein RuvA [Actinomycetota bacterium]|nr:Holliday junction branch migration protein RuvA [Actinomycetota bacterium]
MIGSLRGTLVERVAAGESSVDLVVDVGGVGYRVLVSARCAAWVGPVGADAALAVHTHVREGAITLYGFPDASERRAFELLIGAPGIGPALALAILGTYEPAELARAVAEGDVDALVAVPGVGRKTAARLVVELGQRAEQIAGLPDARAVVPRAFGRPPGATGEVAEALAALGYASEEIRGALQRIGSEGSVESLLRDALRELAPAR